jgi:hypothetical protein
VGNNDLRPQWLLPALRATRKLLRLLRRFSVLTLAACTLLLLTSSSTSTAEGLRLMRLESPPPEETTTTSSTTTIPPPEGLDSFESFDLCNEAESRTEWATCSTAYNVDKLRSEMIIAAFLCLLLLTVIAFGVIRS